MAEQNNNWDQQPDKQPGSSCDQHYQVPPSPVQGSQDASHYPQQPVYAYPPQPTAYQPRPKKSHGWIVALVAVILLFLTLVVGMVSCSGAVASLASPLASPASSGLVLTDSVGVIDIGGTIQYDGSTCSPEGLKVQLDRAENDSHIKAIVLRVDSGGGTATAGEEMAAYLRDFSKPVVVSSASINASAAYEISSQADYIYTAKTTAIGAVGTALQVTDLSTLLDKLGIKVENITSADSKDSSYGTRPLTDEERAYYQKQVDAINETFIETVAEGRAMSTDEVRVLATGLTFTGMDAVQNGLADEIGTLEDACAKAAELAHISDYETLYLEEESFDMSSLLGVLGSSSSSQEQLIAAIKELGANGSLS
ncbi:MAG: signal peptide peptidase SppA [Raoultibacter sp.]